MREIDDNRPAIQHIIAVAMVIQYCTCYLYLFSCFRLLSQAQLEVLAFQRAVKEFMLTIDDAYGKQFEEFYVGFEGSFGGKHVTPRSISARHLGSLVCVEGIVTKCKPLYSAGVSAARSIHPPMPLSVQVLS